MTNKTADEQRMLNNEAKKTPYYFLNDILPNSIHFNREK